MRPWDYFRISWIIGNTLICIFLLNSSVFFVVFSVFNLIALGILALACSHISWSWFIPSKVNGYSKNGVSLTFDDGPTEQTVKVLNVLKTYNTKATFFLIGKQCEQYPELVKQIIEEGHTVGLHSYSHSSDLYFKGSNHFSKDVTKCQNVISSIINKKCRWYRTPFGVINPHAAKALKNEKLTLVGWSLRSFDTKHKDPDILVKHISSKVKTGDIILFTTDLNFLT